ncbi:MAG TPA: hypothetical protein VF516_31260, partial [Kofleriaceae bacterium]
VVALAAPGVGHAQPGRAPSDVLREGNTAALAGDWQRVADLVDPLLREQLPVADLAEAHRLAGIAAFFAQRNASAEQHFVTYLRIEPDGRLDPALYPPDVVAFFNDVASRHAAELRALRVRPERPSWLFTLIPPAGQYMNGDHTKAYVLGGVLGALLITNLVTYSYLRQWCDHTQGSGGGQLTCTDGTGPGHDATQDARRLRPFNIASGIGFWVVYAFGVYDGIRGYRRISREQALRPYVTVSTDGSVVGIHARF